MSGTKGHALWLTVVLVAGCASAPEQVAENRSAAEPVRTAAVTGSRVVPNAVVDLNEQVDDSASTVICREMLKPASNVIETVCMTSANWETYERMRERRAQEFVRRLQNGTFR